MNMHLTCPSDGVLANISHQSVRSGFIAITLTLDIWLMEIWIITGMLCYSRHIIALNLDRIFEHCSKHSWLKLSSQVVNIMFNRNLTVRRLTEQSGIEQIRMNRNLTEQWLIKQNWMNRNLTERMCEILVLSTVQHNN